MKNILKILPILFIIGCSYESSHADVSKAKYTFMDKVDINLTGFYRNCGGESTVIGVQDFDPRTGKAGIVYKIAAICISKGWARDLELYVTEDQITGAIK